MRASLFFRLCGEHADSENQDDYQSREHQRVKKLFLAGHTYAKRGQHNADAVEPMQDAGGYDQQLTERVDRITDESQKIVIGIWPLRKFCENDQMQIKVKGQSEGCDAIQSISPTARLAANREEPGPEF
jgi:hypothetical protein